MPKSEAASGNKDCIGAWQRQTSDLLTAEDLAARWHMSPRSFERWRRQGVGPKWVRLRGKILYRLHDVVAYENAQLEGHGT